MKRHINLAALRNAACAAALLISPLAARAVEYEFTNVMRGPNLHFIYSGYDNYFDLAPAINNSGTVAFWATDEYGTEGFYKTAPGDRPAWAAAGPYGSFHGRYPTLNNNGDIGYVAHDPWIATWTAYVGSASNSSQVVYSAEPGAYIETMNLNDSGTAAFSTYNSWPYSTSARRGAPGATASIASSPDWAIGNLSLDNNGTVAVSASRRQADGTWVGGVYLIDSSGGANLVPSSDIYGLRVSYEGGHVAVIAEEGVWTGNASGLTRLADGWTNYDFSYYEMIDVNASGQVAFTGRSAGGDKGIFTGPNPTRDLVIQAGYGQQYPFGIISDLILGPDSLNDSGQITFAYQTIDGMVGVGLATPINLPPSLDYNKGQNQSDLYSLNEAANWSGSEDPTLHRAPTVNDRIRFKPAGGAVSMRTYLAADLSVAALAVNNGYVMLEQNGHDLTIAAANEFDGAITVKGDSPDLSISNNSVNGTIRADAVKVLDGGALSLTGVKLVSGDVTVQSSYGDRAWIDLTDSTLTASSLTIRSAAQYLSNNVDLTRSTANISGDVTVAGWLSLSNSTLNAARIVIRSDPHGQLSVHNDNVINAPVDIERGSLTAEAYNNTPARLTINGSLSVQQVSSVNIFRYGESSGESSLTVNGALNNEGYIELRDGKIKATAFSLSNGHVRGNGRIEGHLHQTGGYLLPYVWYSGLNVPSNNGVLTLTDGITQTAGGTLRFDAWYGLGRLDVTGGEVDLAGTLRLTSLAAQTIAGATLITYADPNPSIRFKSILAEGLPADKAMMIVQSPGAYGIRLLDAADAGQRLGTDIASAGTLHGALNGYTYSADVATGSVSLYNDNEEQILRLADTVGSPVILQSPSLTLGQQLNVAFEYKFRTSGKLEVLFHDAAGTDTLLTRLSRDWASGDYSTHSELLLLGSDGLNLAGHSGQIWFRLSNLGDPELYLRSLEMINITGIIPEPSCLGLLAVGALGLMRRRRAA